MYNSLIKKFRTQVFAILLILLGSLSIGVTTAREVKAQSLNIPEISNITPSILRIEGGVEVVVTGKNFSSDTIVILGSEIINNRVVTSNEIRFQAPSQNIVGAKTLTVVSNQNIAQKELRVIDRSVSGISVGEITTIAGGEVSTGSGELASNVHFLETQAINVDSQGNIFVLQRFPGRIQQIDASSGRVTTIAGLGNSTKDGDLAVLSKIQPTSMVLDKAGNIFFSDTLTNTVKRIDAVTKTIKTVAGGKLGTSSGNGGLAIDASLGNFLSSIALDQNGNLFLISRDIDPKTELSKATVRKVDGKTGIINNFAGNGENDFSGDGGLAINAGLGPESIITDAANNLIVLDRSNNRIRRVDATTGIITTIAGNGKDGLFDNSPIAGKPATEVPLFPITMALDKDGNLLLNDIKGLFKLDFKTSLLNELPIQQPTSGTDIYGMSGNFTVNNAGNIVFASDGRIFERLSNTTSGEVRQLAGSRLFNFTEDGTTPAVTSNLGLIGSVTTDLSGNIFMTDARNAYIRKIDARSGLITTVAGNGPRFIFTEGGGDGKPATSPDVSLSPGTTRLDSLGNLFITDPFDERVRRVDALSGIISTFAGNSSEKVNGDGGLAKDAGIGNVQDITFDPQGNLFISGNNYIRRVDGKTKIISTVAGNGKGTFSGDGGVSTNSSGAFTGITSDSKGNLFVVDSDLFSFGKDRIRRIDANTKIITTVAGNGQQKFSGENGPAINAGLGFVTSVAVNSVGDLFIGAFDFTRDDNSITSIKYDYRVWKVDAKTGIITVAASGSNEPTNDSRPTKLDGIPKVSLDQNENLLVAEQSFLTKQVSGIKLLKLSDKVKTSIDVFITNANYEKPSLTIQGGGFGNNGITIKINDQDVTKQMTNQNNEQITLKGTRKQLNIRKSTNQIVVTNANGIIARGAF
ncbi:MAG: IPT/TIG domain-containing protein [Acidobacteria bacterium]|nr:IPT/TIG domain-containing protein [Acidobacteriota bacterium]